MFPPESIVRGAVRWLSLIRTSTLEQASSLIRANASYTDLTQTQYVAALDWLSSMQFLEMGRLPLALRDFSEEQLYELLFMRGLEGASPAWLRDADVLVPDATVLPEDVAVFAQALNIGEESAYHAIRQVHGFVDANERARRGLEGELALIKLLEQKWPKSTTHVSQISDAFGYDVVLRHGGFEWHLEVKTTTRRGRLMIFLSRHEHEVGLRDENWRLVVVGLDETMNLLALATVRHADLLVRAPKDKMSESKWQSASHQLISTDLTSGLSFLLPPLSFGAEEKAAILMHGGDHSFSWMP